MTEAERLAATDPTPMFEGGLPRRPPSSPAALRLRVPPEAVPLLMDVLRRVPVELAGVL